MMPFLVAISSTPKTEKLESELEALGFNMFIENPLQNENVDQLITILEERKEELE